MDQVRVTFTLDYLTNKVISFIRRVKLARVNFIRLMTNNFFQLAIYSLFKIFS